MVLRLGGLHVGGTFSTDISVVQKTQLLLHGLLSLYPPDVKHSSKLLA